MPCTIRCDEKEEEEEEEEEEKEEEEVVVVVEEKEEEEEEDGRILPFLILCCFVPHCCHMSLLAVTVFLIPSYSACWG